MCSSQLPRSGAWPQTQLALTQALAQLAVELDLTLYSHHCHQNCTSVSTRRDTPGLPPFLPELLLLFTGPPAPCLAGPPPSQVAPVVKNLPAKAGDMRDAGSIPGLGRSLRGGNGTPLQSSYLENPTDRGAWRAMVHGVAKSQIRLK